MEGPHVVSLVGHWVELTKEQFLSQSRVAVVVETIGCYLYWPKVQLQLPLMEVVVDFLLPTELCLYQSMK